jgi:hypothetical protein
MIMTKEYNSSKCFTKSSLKIGPTDKLGYFGGGCSYGIAIQSKSGTTTGTTVIGSDSWVQETLGPNTKDIIGVGAPLSDVWYVWTENDKKNDKSIVIGSIDTVSGTTGTTMITPTSIEMTTSDVGGTNLLTINSEGINISNETEGWTSANTRRTFKKTLNQTTVQSLGTPLELIPAPGDGKIINVESITLKIQGEGAAITPYGGGVVLDFTFDGAHVPVFQSNELLLSSASRILAIPRAPEPSGPSEKQIIANTKLSIATNSLSNPTGGEGLVGISIDYTVEDDTWV